MNVVASVTDAWSAFATKIGAFLPDLLAAIALLVFGWLLGNVVKNFAIRLLRLLNFDHLAEKSGINRSLMMGGIKQTPTELLGILIFWFLFLFFTFAALDTLGLPGVTDTLNTIFFYLPKIAAAVILLIIGLYFANFLETVTRTSCANAGLKQAEAIGRVAYYGTVIFIIAAILEILDIAAEIVMWAFVLLFGSVCLALALAFGLGGREVAARYLHKWLEEHEPPK